MTNKERTQKAFEERVDKLASHSPSSDTDALWQIALSLAVIADVLENG